MDGVPCRIFIQLGCRPFVRKNVEAVWSFFIRFDSMWMVLFLYVVQLVSKWRFRCGSVEVRSAISCQRKYSQVIQTFSKATSRISQPAESLYCVINYVLVMAGWLDMDGFKCCGFT